MNTQALKNPLEGLTSKEIKAYLKQIEDQERSENAQKREAYESLRNDTVENLVVTAVQIRDLLKDFASKTFNDLGTIHELLKEYSERHELGKGNFQIYNDKKDMRIQFRANNTGFFDERSVQAEKHIQDFIVTQFSGDADTKDMISSLIERSKGRLDVKLVQKLYKYEDRWDDANWRMGIKLLKESWTEGKTRYYAMFAVLFNDVWQTIVMDFATLCNQE